MELIKNLLSSVRSSVILFILIGFDFQSASAQLTLSTQPEKVQTRQGNKQFKTADYTDAEASYKKALDIKNNMPEATFNLGDAVYEQKRYDDAAKQFQLSAQTNQDPKIKAGAYHNLGNTFIEQKKWEEAVKAYKNALKSNPKDEDTRYNLAYANAMLQKNKGGGGQSKQDQKNQKDKKDDKNKDQNRDKDNKDNKDNKDKQDQQKQDQSKNQDQKDKQDQQKPGQQSKLSKEESEKLLQALMNEEEKTTQKVQQKQMKAVRVKIKKDW